MADRHLKLRSPGTTVERRCRRVIPELDWRDCQWPESGLFRDLFWAAKHDLSLEALRELIRELDIPHIQIRRVMWIDAIDMRAAFKKVRWSELKRIKKTNKPSSKESRKPTDD